MGKSTEPQKNALIRNRGDAYHIVAATLSQEMQTAISSQLPGLEQYAQSRAVTYYLRFT